MIKKLTKDHLKTLADKVVGKIVGTYPATAIYADALSIRWAHFPVLYDLYETDYFPLFRDAPNISDFEKLLQKDIEKWKNEIPEKYQVRIYTEGEWIKAPMDESGEVNGLYLLFINTLKIDFFKEAFSESL